MAADVKEKVFIEDVLRKATAIITNFEELHQAVDVYGDRSYSSALEDDDFLAYGLTKAQFTAIANFDTNFTKFLDNIDPDNADYRKILNIIRTDK